MNICIPVNEDRGLGSTVCDHFGSTPLFLVVDTETRECRAIPNVNAHHGHGMCAPLKSLEGERLDGIVVGGIGAGALRKLAAAGLEVYRASAPTVGETLAAFGRGELSIVDPANACGEHRHHGA